MLSFKAAALALSVIGASGTLYFTETFDEGDVFASGKWVLSSQEKYNDQPVMIKAGINSPPELKDDKGVELTQEMKFYGRRNVLFSKLIVIIYHHGRRIWFCIWHSY
jgi:hypothetical protein